MKIGVMYSVNSRVGQGKRVRHRQTATFETDTAQQGVRFNDLFYRLTVLAC